MSQIKYYKSKDVSNMTSLKILNDGVLYALKKKKNRNYEMDFLNFN